MLWDVLVDAALVGGFGVQHSLLARVPVKKVVRERMKLDPVAWRGVQSLFNISYVILAAMLWQDIDVVVWDLDGAAYAVAAAVLALGWLWYFQIHLFEYDVGLAFGSSAVINHFMGRPSPPLEMWSVGQRRWLRFPVHTAFFPMFFAFPRMTVSTLVFAVVANVYNWIGTVLYDRRLERLIGRPYYEYEKRTGLVFWPLRRAPSGAAAMGLPKPTHWSKPSLNVPGVVLGVLGGLVYWLSLGVLERTPGQLMAAWGLSFCAAIVGGAVLGLVKSARVPAPEGLDRFQTELSTNSAAMSAVAIVTWAGIAFALERTVPHLAPFLPMWITVLWIGHVVALVIARAFARAPAGAGSRTAPATR